MRAGIALCLTVQLCLAPSPSTDPFLAWLDRIAQQQLDERERAIAAIRTRADADRRKAMVRAKLTELIGGLPTYSGPLNARITGRLKSDRIHFFVGTGPHGTPKDSREEIYRWMIHWLADGKGDPRDQPVKLYTNLDLQVTKSGNVDGEPGGRKLYQIIAEEFRARRQKRGVPELLAELRRLGVPSKGPTPPTVTTSKIERSEFAIEEIRFESEPGVTVSARLYLPKPHRTQTGGRDV